MNQDTRNVMAFIEGDSDLDDGEELLFEWLADNNVVPEGDLEKALLLINKAKIKYRILAANIGLREKTNLPMHLMDFD